MVDSRQQECTDTVLNRVITTDSVPGSAASAMRD
jgi:hypothetical protein